MGCPDCDRLRRELREAREELAEYEAAGPAPAATGEAARMGRWMAALGCPHGQAQMAMVFAEAPDRTFSRDELVEKLRGCGRADPFDRSVDTRIKRLRRSLKAATGRPDTIRTQYGVGYYMDAATARAVRAIAGEVA